AGLLLERWRAAEVKTLAEEMLMIFRTQEVEREALAALRLFCDSAQQESATSELAHRIVKFLHRAQHDPELSFFGTGKGLEHFESPNPSERSSDPGNGPRDRSCSQRQ